MANQHNKISVVRKILDAKDVLFGKFSDKLTKDMKMEEWDNVRMRCLELGLVQGAKDAKYVRDVFWANIKRATLAKRDNSRKTGAAGGRAQKLTELDTLVLEVIGKESPTCDGIRPQEPEGEQVSLQELASITLEDCNDAVSLLPVTEVAPTEKGEEPVSQLESSRKRKRCMENGSFANEKAQNKKNKEEEKVDWQIENLKLQNENFKLKNKALQLQFHQEKFMRRKGVYTPLFF